MLRVSDLVAGFGRTNVLRDISFEIEPGAFTVLMGRNGAGKTTLLRSIVGVMDVRGGAVEFEGAEITRTPSYARIGLGIGYMPEDRKLVPHWTVRDNIALPRWAASETRSFVSVDEVVEMIPELGPVLHRQAGKLSGGQQKLVSLGRALTVGHKLLLLDEPFEGVAPALAERLLEILRIAVRRGKQAVLLTESDRSLSSALRTHMLVLERGELKTA